MGQFHFDVPEAAKDFVEQSLWRDAYLCGIEGVPWRCENVLRGSRLSISREISSSGKLYLACPIEGIGYRTLSTCSLRPTEEAHLLPLELSRGSCFRARVQADAWQRAGLSVSDEFETLLQTGTSHFLDAAQRRADPNGSARAAMEAIRLLEQAISELGELYAVQSISFRKQREPQIGTLLAGTVLPPQPTNSALADRFQTAFNAAAVRLSWADIETDAGRFDYQAGRQSIDWCAAHGLRVIGGPLIDFRERLMPHWLYLLEDDFDSFLDAVTQFVSRTVLHFRGSVQLWNCAAGLNTPGPIALDDEQVMRLAIGVLQAVRRSDPNTPAIMSFDQPFGEYLAKHREGISPMHFADAVARTGVGLAGLGLDVRLNYHSGGTMPRSAVDFGQMIDRWATLGLPLLVQIGVPGQRGIDPNAVSPSEVLWTPGSTADPAAEQMRIAAPLIRTLLAKHVVHGVVWDGWSDAQPHVLSHSGVLDVAGRPRPLLEYFTRIRRDFLA